jgi:hypothetical protein
VHCISIFSSNYIAKEQIEINMKPDENISFHSYENPDFTKLVQLTKSAYDGREISSEEFLDWEYEKNPEGKALIDIAETEDEVVSQYILLPIKFFINKNIVVGSLSVNTLTLESHRKKGLFVKLAKQAFDRCAKEKIHFTIGFPNPVFHPIIEKFNLFNTIGSLPLLIYPVSPLRSLVKYLKGNNIKSGEEIFLKILSDDFNEFPGTGLFDFNIDGIEYKNLLNKFNEQKFNVKHRSLEYLKWRFSDIPLRKYYLLKFQTSNEICALIILRAKHIFGLRCLILVDMISADDGSGLKNLFEITKKVARKNNIDLIFSAIPKHSPENKFLKRSGFITVPDFLMPQKILFITKRNSDECPDGIDDFKKWFLTFGDFDIF